MFSSHSINNKRRFNGAIENIVELAYVDQLIWMHSVFKQAINITVQQNMD